MILALEPVRGAFADDDDVDVATGADTGLKPNAHAENCVATRTCSTTFDPEEGHTNGLRNRMLLAFFCPRARRLSSVQVRGSRFEEGEGGGGDADKNAHDLASPQ